MGCIHEVNTAHSDPLMAKPSVEAASQGWRSHPVVKAAETTLTGEANTAFAKQKQYELNTLLGICLQIPSRLTLRRNLSP